MAPLPLKKLFLLPCCLASFFFFFFCVSQAHLEQNCSTSAHTCQAFLAFSPLHSVLLPDIARLFGIDPQFLLRLNDLQASPGKPIAVPAHYPLKIPQSCVCFDGRRRGNSTFYQVKRGDTLSHIAARYGNWVSYQQIAAVNHIPNPDLIFPMQRFVIPFPCACNEGGMLENRTGFVSYRVRSGDTLVGIASHYNLTVEELSGIDGISDSFVTAGAVIYVPLSATSAPAHLEEFHALLLRDRVQG